MHYCLLVIAVASTTSFLLPSCRNTSHSAENKTADPSGLDRSAAKMVELLQESEAVDKIPRSEERTGEIIWATKRSDSGEIKFDWTLGFFPGSCWYLYEYTGDEKWKDAAITFQAQFEDLKYFSDSHDLGFVFHCSFGNAYRIDKSEEYKAVVVEAGNTLLTRFNKKVGCIQSWNVDKGWQSQRDWKFPVIIDNMMNLEMLFELSSLTGDPKYREVAISHADVTLANHFREDNSSYHVVDYDPESGKVRKKNTAQGYSHESAWARGQAWGLYGFVVCYRYTKDSKYLRQAEEIADFIQNHANLPADGIPYWDFNAPNIPNEPRDASAAAITASALVELNNYTNNRYGEFLDTILQSLKSDDYSVAMGGKTKFILDHSVGSIPHGAEIDKPLVYADYYYLEALIRLSKGQDTDYQAFNHLVHEKQATTSHSFKEINP
ncbi:MAG: glycoside hydrolase family 88 protein [Bacteroidota bacterium]